MAIVTELLEEPVEFIREGRGGIFLQLRVGSCGDMCINFIEILLFREDNCGIAFIGFNEF